jgi:hypothetical protein
MRPEMQIQCRNCQGSMFLKPTGYYGDGSHVLACSCCEQDGGILHPCSHDHPTANPRWLPLLIAGIGIICPACRKTYDFGMALEPTYPEAGQALQSVGLVAGVIVLVGVIGDILNGKRRRRRS